MSAAITAALPYLSAAGAAVQIGTAILGAKSGQDAAAAQAAQLADEKRNAETQAVIDETERRRELASVLATQKAVRSGRGLDLFSPTFENIQDVTVRQAEDDISLIQLNSLNRQRRLGLGIDQANAQGQSAVYSGIGGAASGLGKLAEAAGKIK